MPCWCTEKDLIVRSGINGCPLWLGYYNKTGNKDRQISSTVPHPYCRQLTPVEADLISVSEGGVVFRSQQAATQVTGAGQQGRHRGLRREEVTGLHAEETQEHGFV